MTLVCPACFGDTGLQRRIEEIRPNYDEGNCDFHPRRKGTPLEVVAEIVDEVFRGNYDFGAVVAEHDLDPDEPHISYRQGGEDLSDSLRHLTKAVDDEVVERLIEVLESDEGLYTYHHGDPFYDPAARYERRDPGEAGHGSLWQNYCESVMHSQRFFNDEARGFLEQIFRNIHLQKDTSRRYPVFMMEPSRAPVLHRARIVHPDAVKELLDEPVPRLGPPPRRMGKANRMNVSGIPAFYGSLDLATCVSELRPLVGDTLAHAEFRLRRPICVLDTTRFEAPPKELNLFAKDHIRRLAQWRFMQRLTIEIARPISPGDEHIDYVPTQVVAEYLNKVHLVRMNREKRHIDAIIYRSAQRPGGRNIVLLGEAGLVARSSEEASAPRPPAPSLSRETGEQAAPRPGLSLDAQTVRISTVKSAGFELDEPSGLRMMLEAMPSLMTIRSSH